MDEIKNLRNKYEDQIPYMSIKGDGIKVVFADELSGCRILVHKDALPAPLMQKLVSAYIITAGEFMGVKAFKCAYIEDEHAFTMSYKRFPEFFGYFKQCFGGIGNAFDYVDLSLLNTETRKAEFKNGEFVFSAKDSHDLGRSKLQSLRDNPDVLFMLDKKTNVLHDKSCKELDNVPFEDLEVFRGELFEEHRFCRNCRDRLHIRLACGDDFKHYSLYKRFFSDGGLSEVDIEYYITQYDFNMSFAGPNILQVKVNDDTWQIRKNSNKNYTLLHNNYSIADSGQRLIGNIKNFHVQCQGKSLEKIFDRICSYSYDKHLEAANNQVEENAELN